MLTATKVWHCECGCDELIKPGDKFDLKEGTFYKEGHQDLKIKQKEPSNAAI